MPTMYETKKSDTEGRIKELEEELAKTKYNKSTQHHIGLIKAKIAELREKASSSKKGKTTGYTLKKSGDASVALLGFPSVGKSTLLNAITNAESKVGSYDFTTLDVIPGLLDYENAKIQIFDIPGIVTGAASGSGRGKEVLSAIRAVDLILILIDIQKPQHHKIIEKEVWDAGIRINAFPPDVKFKKTGMGGIEVSSTCKLTKLNKEMVKDIVTELGILNCDIIIRENVTVDQLIDAVQGNRIYIPGITVINKSDLNPKKAEAIRKKLKADIVISSLNEENVEDLKKLIFTQLGLIRIYLKEVGKKTDDEPLIIKNGATVRDVCTKIHRDFLTKFKYAKVWGSSKFPGQRFGLDKEVKDKDIVEIHLL